MTPFQTGLESSVASLKVLFEAPLLFLLFINDLASIISSNSDLFLFADDAKLFRYIAKQSDSIDLQQDLHDLHRWINNSLLSLNVSKCKVMSYGRTISFKGQYYIDNERLEKVDTMKDLRLTFDADLKFREHIIDRVNNAYSVIGIIKRNFMYLSETSICSIYKAMVRSQLEYAVAVWNPYRKEVILRIEKVQIWATKIVSSVKRLPYKDRHKRLQIPTLKFRRIRGNMIEVYKAINQYYDRNTTVTFDLVGNSVTRGNKYKLRQSHCKYDLRKQFFTNRIVAIWNSLPDYVVDAHSVNVFENRLDKTLVHSRIIL